MIDLSRFTDDHELFDPEQFARLLAQGEEQPLPLFKRALKHGTQVLRQRFDATLDSRQLVCARAYLVDQLLIHAWLHWLGPHHHEASLVAVGGYGRGELHPGSDVDLMIILPEPCDRAITDALQTLLTFLWDIGLEVGHSVRTVDDCVRESKADITVATNLMESRLLSGAESLYMDMRALTDPEHCWNSKAFFEAKWQEQQERHLKYHDTAYNLEPNIKESPGGLRDIHMVGWVAKRHFGANTLHDLVDHEFLTEQEHAELLEGQNFLWDVRFALHELAGRREDRLLFDFQKVIAARFGYEDDKHNLAVEKFMQRYYRTVMELSRLNEMLLQLFQEAILYAEDEETPVLINKRFQARKGFIEVTHRNVFKRYPFALLEIFLLLQQHPELKGVRASTIRLICEHRDLIDRKFRGDLRARSLFMEIMRQPQGITHETRRMHRYGILGRYLPAFGRIIGRMQYDLFHVYTVDSHTLFVVRNLRRFALDKHANELPLCNTIMASLPKPELLYLAGLFHDIAKGRGGDHSELGAEDAYRFCVEHGLSTYDARLVSWLVRNHLLMSMTAQRKDIHDPQVINDFSEAVGDRSHLDHLYLLTVADIRATNPTLWNSWRDSLLMELYTATKRALRRGLGNPIDEEELIHETQDQARRRLQLGGLHHMTARAIWKRFTDDYFLRHSAEEIAWHTAAIARAKPSDLPLVLINEHGSRGGTDIFVYTEDRDHVFALTAYAIDQLGLNIQDARIISTQSGQTLNSYLVLENDGQPVSDSFRSEEIVEKLRQVLRKHDDVPEPPNKSLPRQLRHFTTKTSINFSNDIRHSHTVMELITGDRPGLLSRVGYALSHCGVRLRNAKIATIGEKAEDVFFLTDRDNHPIADTKVFDCLRDTLTELLEDEQNAVSATGGA